MSITTTITYGVGDLNNGIIENFTHLNCARAALKEAIEYGVSLEMETDEFLFDSEESLFVETYPCAYCDAQTFSDKEYTAFIQARVNDFYFIVEVTEEYDEEGDLVSESQKTIF